MNIVKIMKVINCQAILLWQLLDLLTMHFMHFHVGTSICPMRVVIKWMWVGHSTRDKSVSVSQHWGPIMENQSRISYQKTHTIHMYIYLHLPYISTKCKYSSPMDAMGYFNLKETGILCLVSSGSWPTNPTTIAKTRPWWKCLVSSHWGLTTPNHSPWQPAHHVIIGTPCQVNDRKSSPAHQPFAPFGLIVRLPMLEFCCFFFASLFLVDYGLEGNYI